MRVSRFSLLRLVDRFLADQEDRDCHLQRKTLQGNLTRMSIVTIRERPKSAPYLRLKKTRKPLFLQLETIKALKNLKIEK